MVPNQAHKGVSHYALAMGRIKVQFSGHYLGRKLLKNVRKAQV